MTSPLEPLIAEVYGSGRAPHIASRINEIIDTHPRRGSGTHWDQDDVWLITYADHFQREGERPLRTLLEFYRSELSSHLNGMHILPFFPWTSDDGFSVADYSRVDPRYGAWDDVEQIGASTRLMIDGVFNHLSAGSRWFERFLLGDPEFANHFKTASPSEDLSEVVRPRTHPLLTPFDSHSGTIHVWTTFSTDQVDLDFANPDVLIRIVQILLDYAQRGAQAIRLDAVCFLWKQPGTTSIHLPQTHALVQIMRACLDATYPHVLLISETNVPHAENVSYLGTGDTREAQAVYQFSLPPLTLHATLTGNTSYLAEWAASSASVSGEDRTFFNFLSSHDGIGVRPVEGLLPASEVARLVESCLEVGGGVNRRRLSDGSETPYELNTTWFDAMTFGVDEGTAIRRHLASHALMLAMPGIAGLYVQSLFGASNDREGAERTGMNRSLNRRKYTDVPALIDLLRTEGTRQNAVLSGIRAAIDARRRSPAFHPNSGFDVLDLPPSAIGVERTAADGHRGRCIVNFGDHPVVFDQPGWTDVRGFRVVPELGPLDVRWSYRRD